MFKFHSVSSIRLFCAAQQKIGRENALYRQSLPRICKMCGVSCEQIAPPRFPADSSGDVFPGPTKTAYLPFQFGEITSVAFIACRLPQRRLIRTSILWKHHITFVSRIQERFSD
ncbi:hypothetical protein OBV_05280 [Oscillibacter valericigenes Sjm18-20]|nr:hypothetical protein OBV_05280 [Oscillibacter valericigenes Sjm18-20]